MTQTINVLVVLGIVGVPILLILMLVDKIESVRKKDIYQEYFLGMRKPLFIGGVVVLIAIGIFFVPTRYPSTDVDHILMIEVRNASLEDLLFQTTEVSQKDRESLSGFFTLLKEARLVRNPYHTVLNKWKDLTGPSRNLYSILITEKNDQGIDSYFITLYQTDKRLYIEKEGQYYSINRSAQLLEYWNEMTEGWQND